MKYILAIDETGEFDYLEKDPSKPSFIGGILIEKSAVTGTNNGPSKLRQSFMETYEDCYTIPAPTNLKELLDSFHYSEIKEKLSEVMCRNLSKDDSNKLIASTFEKIKCKLVLPYVKRIYVSTGKPIVIANKQDWWKSALICVISEALKNMEADDSIEEIRFDSRATTVLGLGFKGLKISEQPNETIIEIPRDYTGEVAEIKIESDQKGPHPNGKTLNYDADQNIKVSLTFNNTNTKWKDYHNKLAQGIGSQFDNNIKYSSNSKDECVALADLVCGFVAKSDLNNINIPITNCPCAEYDSGVDPLREKNSIYAIAAVLQNAKNQKAKIIKQIFSQTIEDTKTWDNIWDMFYDFVKYKINERNFSKETTNVVKTFFEEFKDRYIGRNKNINLFYTPTKPPKRFYELMNLFVEYYSHCGDIKFPLGNDTDIIQYRYLRPSDEIEGRALVRWTNYVSYILHTSEIFLNAYDFDAPLKKLDILKITSKHIDMLTTLNDETKTKDENLTALLGTIGQSYAYKYDYDKAVKFFEESTEYAIKTNSKSKTYSYLFTISHLKQEYDEASVFFNKQTDQYPENFNKNNINKKTGFYLLSYCKLYALGCLQKIKKTMQLSIDDLKSKIIELEKAEHGILSYEFYLAMKWRAIAHVFENEDNASKTETAELFYTAIDRLLNSGEFTLKTLALPIIQCLARLEADNEHCRNYAQYMQELTKQSGNFARYMDKHAEFKEINTEASLWDCATFLPFIYS